MNCAECRDNLIACAEGLLDEAGSLACQTHLETCARCRAEYQSVTRLQRQLIAHGQTAATIKLVQPVMRRVFEEKHERNTIMSLLLKHRWGFGLSAAATAVALVAGITLFSPPKIQAAVDEVMTKGAQAAAKLTAIHLRGQMRAPPQENFSAINLDSELSSVEMWKQFAPDAKWRVEKPGRIAVMDGTNTVLFIKPDFALKIPNAAASAFDTQWLHEIANLSQALEQELSAIKAHGWQVTLAQQTGADGKPKSIITVEAKSGLLVGDYLKNHFFDTTDTRRVYVFDNDSELLESMQIFAHTGSGDKLVFELDQIDYNQPIDPAQFQLQVPATVAWNQEMQILPDNAKYAAMTSEQAARAFFEACGKQDWIEAGKFCTMTGSLKDALGGSEVVNIGTHFTAAISLVNGAQFVPYEVKLTNGQVKKFNLSLKRDAHTQRWFVDGGI